MSDDIFGDYLQIIGAYPVLTREEEQHWFRLLGEAHQDPELAHSIRNYLVLHNLKLVIGVARKFGWAEVPLIDLVQEGNLGLFHAIGKFDYTKGFKFSTYAMAWIKQSIQRALPALQRAIRLPVHVEAKRSSIMYASRELETDLGRPPTIEELCARTTEKDPAVVQALLDIARAPRSLDAPLYDDGEASLVDALPGVVDAFADEIVERMQRDEMTRRLYAALSLLPDPQRIAIEGIVMRDRSAEEVGRTLGVNAYAARLHRDYGLERLRDAFGISHVSTARERRHTARTLRRRMGSAA